MIKPFDDNYQRMAEIRNLNRPDLKIPAEFFAQIDKSRKPNLVYRCFIKEIDNKMVAFASIGHQEVSFHPQRFAIDIQVDPNYQGQGIGKELYEFLLQQAKELQADVLRSRVREDKEPAVSFLKKRGFKELDGLIESRLDIDSFDLSKYKNIYKKIEDKGYQIKTLAEFSDDFELTNNLYQLEVELTNDIPSI